MPDTLAPPSSLSAMPMPVHAASPSARPAGGEAGDPTQ